MAVGCKKALSFEQVDDVELQREFKNDQRDKPEMFIKSD
jgi:hypothetical protein